MLPDPSSLRQVEGQKGPHRDVPREAVDRTHARHSQRDANVEEDKDNLGIEDGDPRWSKRELVLKRLDVPQRPDALPNMGPDAADFRGQPGDPFEVLIKRREEKRQKAKRGARELAVSLATGIPALDEVLDGLEPRVYAICGPAEAARALAHQIACFLAREHPVVYLSYSQPARDLTLRALARLSGDRATGDLARAREVADAFRPIRENMTVVEGAPDESVTRLRARMQQVLARRRVRRGAIVLDDLRALSGIPALPEPKPWQKAAAAAQAQATGGPQGAGAGKPGGMQRAPAGWVPGTAGPSLPGQASPGGGAPDQTEASATVPAAKPALEPEILACARSLATVADQVGVPVILVAAADIAGDPDHPWTQDLPEPVRLLLSEPPRGGGPVEIIVHRPQPRTIRPKATPPGPPVVKLDYQPRRTAFEPLSPDQTGRQAD